MTHPQPYRQRAMAVLRIAVNEHRNQSPVRRGIRWCGRVAAYRAIGGTVGRPLRGRVLPLFRVLFDSCVRLNSRRSGSRRCADTATRGCSRAHAGFRTSIRANDRVQPGAGPCCIWNLRRIIGLGCALLRDRRRASVVARVIFPCTSNEPYRDTRD